MPQNNDLIVNVTSAGNDAFRITFTYKTNNPAVAVISIDKVIKLEQGKFASTHLSHKNGMLIKTTPDLKKLLIKYEVGKNTEEVNLHVDITGNITLNRAHTSDNFSLTSSGQITLTHGDFHSQNLSLNSKKIINHGILDIKKKLMLEANQGITNTPNGKMRVGEKIDISGSLINQGIIYGQNQLVLDMHNSHLLNTLQKDQKEISSISAENYLSIINAKEIINETDIKTLKKNSTLEIQSSIIENKNHISADVLKIKALSFLNNRDLHFKEKAEITVAHDLINHHYISQAKNTSPELKLEVGTLKNEGQVMAHRILGYVSHLNNNHHIYSNEHLELSVDLLENNKEIVSNNTLTLQIKNEQSNNFGLVEGKNTVNLNIHKNFYNHKDIHSVTGDTLIESQENFQNHGNIQARHNCVIQAKKDMENRGLISGLKECTIKTEGKLENCKIISSHQKIIVQAYTLNNAAEIFVNGLTDLENRSCELHMSVLDALNNKGLISSKAKTHIHSTRILNKGRIETRDTFLVEAHSLENTGAINSVGNGIFKVNIIDNKENADIFVAESFSLQGINLKNSGKIESDTEINFQVAECIDNSKIIHCQDTITTKSKTFINQDLASLSAKCILLNHENLKNSGEIKSSQDLKMKTQTGINNGNINSVHECDIQISEKFIHQTGELYAKEHIRIRGEGELLNESYIHAKQTITLENKKTTNQKTVIAPTITSKNDTLINNNQIIAEKMLNFHNNELKNSENSTLHSDDAAVFEVVNQITNHGKISAQKAIKITSQSEFSNFNEIMTDNLNIHAGVISNKGKLFTKQSLSLNAQESITNHQNGLLQSDGTLSLHAKNHIIHAGKISSNQELNIMGEGTLQQAGEIHCNTDVVITMSSEITHIGTLQAVGNLKIKSQMLKHETGIIAANKDIILEAKAYYLFAEITSQEGLLSLMEGNKLRITGKILAKTIRAKVHSIVNNGKISAAEEVHLFSEKNITNDSQIRSAHHTVHLEAKGTIYQNKDIEANNAILIGEAIINNSDLNIKNTLSFEAVKNITNTKPIKTKGAIRFTVKESFISQVFLESNEINICAKSLTIQEEMRGIHQIKLKAQDNLNIQSKISSENLELEATDIINSNRLETTKHFSINHTSNFSNYGLVGSQGSLSIQINNQLFNAKGCNILSHGNMNLHASKLVNQSARLHSNENITLKSNEIINIRHIKIDSQVINAQQNAKYDLVREKDQPAVIYAQKNLILDIGVSAKNYMSLVYASGNIMLKGNGAAHVVNIPQNLYMSKQERHERKGKRKIKKGFRREKIVFYTWTTPKSYEIIPAAVCGKNIQMGNLQSFRNEGLIESYGFTFTGVTVHNGREDDFRSGLVQLPNQRIGLISYFQKPSSPNALYQYWTPTTNHHYVMTTSFMLEPNLPDLRGFLMRENIRLNRTLAKRRLLGDISYTANLLQLAAFDNTGRPYIEQKMLEMLCTGQAMHYFNNALQFSRQHPATKMGKPLSEHALQNLTTPLLWPVKAWVGSEEKIVSFEIYLPHATQHELLLQDDGQIHAKTAEINVIGDAKNTGYLTVTDELTVICQNFMNAQRVIHEKEYVSTDRGFWRSQKTVIMNTQKPQPGGEVRAGKISIKARQDVLNRGNILSRQELSLIAGRHIINKALVRQSIVTWEIGRFGKLMGNVKSWDIAIQYIPATITSVEGKVTLFAGDQIQNIGSLIAAKDDIVLEAQKLVKQDVMSSTHLKKNSVHFHRFQIKKQRQYEMILQRSEVCSTSGNVTFTAYQGDIFNVGSTILSAMKIVLNAKGGIVEICPFIAKTEDTVMATGLEGLGFKSTKMRRDHTQIEPSVILANDIEINATLDVNIKGTLLHAMETLAIKSGRDINIRYETIHHYVKSEGFSATLSFFGSNAINHMIAQDCEKAAVALLHEFPILASYDNLLHSKDTADVTGNGIHALYQTYKHLKEIENASRDFSKILKNHLNFNCTVRLSTHASEKYWTEILTTWLSAQKIILKAERNINLAAIQVKADDAEITAQGDINLESGIEGMHSKSNESGIAFNLGMGLPVGIDTSHASSQALNYVFSSLKVKNTVSFTGKTLNFKGVELEAARIYLEAENLNIETPLNYFDSKSESINININAASLKRQKLTQTFAKKQTTLRALDAFIGHIENTTTIKGAIIETLQGELHTSHLQYENIQGSIEARSITLGITDLGGFSHEQFFICGLGDMDFKRTTSQQTNRSTVSKNIKIITESDYHNLNRDLSHAQELIKQGHHIRLVVPLLKLNDSQSMPISTQKKTVEKTTELRNDPLSLRSDRVKNPNVKTTTKTNSEKKSIKTSTNNPNESKETHIEDLINSNKKENLDMQTNASNSSLTTQPKSEAESNPLQKNVLFWEAEKDFITPKTFGNENNFIGLQGQTKASVNYTQNAFAVHQGKIVLDFIFGVKVAEAGFEKEFEKEYKSTSGKFKIKGNLEGPTAKANLEAILQNKEVGLAIDALASVAAVNGEIEGRLCIQDHCLLIELEGTIGVLGGTATYGLGFGKSAHGKGFSMYYKDSMNIGLFFARKSIKLDYYQKQKIPDNPKMQSLLPVSKPEFPQ